MRRHCPHELVILLKAVYFKDAAQCSLFFINVTRAARCGALKYALSLPQMGEKRERNDQGGKVSHRKTRRQSDIQYVEPYKLR